MPQDQQFMASTPKKKKPGLIPTVGAYSVTALIIVLVMGVMAARSMLDITDMATTTRDEVLPQVIDRQRTAVNLERLGRFAETVYRSDNARTRREYKLASRILSQDAVFDEDVINRQVLDAYHDIEKIAQFRNKQTHLQKQSDAIISGFGPGSPHMVTLLGLRQGKAIANLLFQADRTSDLSTLVTLNDEFNMLASHVNTVNSGRTSPLAQAQEFFDLRSQAMQLSSQCDALWIKVNAELESMVNNLSLSAAATADDRFTLIAEEAEHAMRTGLLAVGALTFAMCILIFFAHRDIVIPILRYVQGLDQVGQGKRDITLPQTRLRELDSIRGAVQRSGKLMAELADRTQAMREANVALEDEIEVRKKTQRELALSKEHAEAADRAKSDFLAGMSHEIRTPMNTILGMADLMLETDPTPQQRQYIEIFQSSGEMLLNIINDVLDLSKIEAGGISLETVPIDLNEFVARTREIVAGRAQQKGLEFIVDVGDDVPESFLGDPVRLRQVLVNLIDNGVKFTDEGSVRLAIQPAKDGPPCALTFAVIDSGIGIPKDAQADIFRRFTQADTSTTRKYGGTGLGLAICSRLVKLMGGTIHLESSPRLGSTFFFTLEFTPHEHAKELTVQRPKDMDSLIAQLSTSLTDILIAEDSDSNQALIELYFKQTTCRLDFAADGKEAVEKFAAKKYDMVLMDIQMPVMDGHEATRQIRKLEQERGVEPTPVVAVTANAFKEDQEHCMDAGCTDYLAKPISKANLLQCVARYVKGKE